MNKQHFRTLALTATRRMYFLFLSALYMCSFLYYIYVFKDVKTGIAEIKEGILGRLVREEKGETISITQQGCHSFQVCGFICLSRWLICNLFLRIGRTTEYSSGLISYSEWWFSLASNADSLGSRHAIFLPDKHNGTSYLYSVNIAAWRPFSFNKRKRQALTIMNLLLRGECTHPKEKFQTVLAELAVMLPPFSLIRDFGKQITRGNVSKISVSLTCYRQMGSKSTNHSH